MNPSRPLLLAAAALAALVVSSCGGGGKDRTETTAKVPAPVIARADANCRYFLRETKRIGREALSGPPATTLELTTERLVKPSIPLLERMGERQQALERAAHSPLFDVYANLFDPVVVLAQSRLSSGRAGNAVVSKQIEERLTDTGLEQRRMARLAGLDDCDLDFQHILLQSLNE